MSFQASNSLLLAALLGETKGVGGTSHFSAGKWIYFFSFFVVLLCLDLLFGEVRGVVGEVRLIFDLMAPFVLGCSPGKTFSPFGIQCFSWQRLCKQECCGRSWLCLTCVWHFRTNSAEQLYSGKHLSTCFSLLWISSEFLSWIWKDLSTYLGAEQVSSLTHVQSSKDGLDGKGAVIVVAQQLWSKMYCLKIRMLQRGLVLFVCVCSQEEEQAWTFCFCLPICSSVSPCFELLCIWLGWCDVGL